MVMKNTTTLSLIIDKPHSQTLTVRNKWKPFTPPYFYPHIHSI